MSSDTLQPHESEVRFIPDEPAESDAFGAHHRIADAVAEVIRKHPKAKVIGLLGRWGSGKTTAVRAIERAFQDDVGPKTFFFTYDAWQHQSDPARRSFLESLIQFLTTRHLVDAATWTAKAQELSGHVERTETENTPALTPAGRWIVFAIALVPLGVALLDYDTIENAFKSNPSIIAQRAFWVAVGLTTLPLVVGLSLYMIWRPWKPLWRSRGRKLFTKYFWTQHRPPHEKDSIASLFMNRHTTTTTNVTAKRPDPTSIEFQAIFRQLMDEAATEGDRFVFVVDNLDRLTETDALQIWSTVRSFFLGSVESLLLKESRALPVVLLPIDPDAVRRMFMIDHGEVMSKDLARAFMDKTFDVTFEIPEPVMSDWREYLSMQVTYSFGGEMACQFSYWAAKFYEHYVMMNQKRVTPRQINRYVNAIASLYLQRHDPAIGLQSIAYFIAFRDLIDDDLLKLLTNSPDVIPADSGWQTQLAALYYGVPVAKADQVLLESTLLDAINRDDAEEFNRLSLIPGFGVEFERMVSLRPPRDQNGAIDLHFVLNSARLLDQLERSDAPWTSHAWQAIVENYVASSTPADAIGKLRDTAKVLVARAGPATRQRFVNVTLAKAGEVLNTASVNSEATSDAVMLADETLAYSRRENLSLPTLPLKKGVGDFLTLLTRTLSKRRVWKQFRNKLRTDELVGELVERLQDPVGHLNVAALLGVLNDPEFKDVLESPKFAWDNLAQAAFKLVSEGTGADVQTDSALEVLGRLQRTTTVAGEHISQLIDEGRLASRADEACAGENWSLLSATLALRVARDADFGPPSGEKWNDILARGDDLVSRVRAHMVLFSGPAVVPRIWAARRTAPTARTLINAMIQDAVTKSGLGSLPVEKVIGDIGSYLEVLNADFQRRFMAEFKDFPGFWDYVEKADLTKGLLVALKALSRGEAQDRDRALQLVKRHANELDDDKWKNAILSGGVAHFLVERFEGRLTGTFSAKSKVYAGLAAAIPDVLAATDYAKIKRWFNVSDILTPEARKSVIHRMAEAIATAKYVARLLFILKQGGVSLLTSKGFPADSLVAKVILPLMDIAPGRSWLRDHVSDMRGVLIRRDASARVELLAALRHMQRSKRTERRDWAKGMIEALNLE